jgi:hypothetical protein
MSWLSGCLPVSRVRVLAARSRPRKCHQAASEGVAVVVVTAMVMAVVVEEQLTVAAAVVVT